jgi:hypothetical protein
MYQKYCVCLNEVSNNRYLRKQIRQVACHGILSVFSNISWFFEYSLEIYYFYAFQGYELQYKIKK